MQDFDLGRLSERLQAAAFEPNLWPQVLDEVSSSFDGAGAQFFSQRKRLPSKPASTSLDPWRAEYLADGWQERSERRVALERLRRGQVIADLDFMTPETIARSPLYQDLLRKHGLGWFACIGFGMGDDVWGMAVQRRTGGGPFSAHDRRCLARLAPLLTDAATIACRLSRVYANGLVDGCQRMRQPCVLFDGKGRVLALNRGAEELIGDMIDAQGMLEFVDADSRDRFGPCLGAALGPVLEATPPTDCEVLDRRGRPLEVHVTALRDLDRFAFVGARAMMMIGQPWPHGAGEATQLRARYRLTRAEWQLVTQLCRGAGLRDAADTVHVTYQTARSTLKQVFTKTRTHRQGELVALLMRQRG